MRSIHSINKLQLSNYNCYEEENENKKNTTYFYSYNSIIFTTQFHASNGSIMPGRYFLGWTGYRWGFNGKENDNEVSGTGNKVDFGARVYDSRLGRWMSTDGMQKVWMSSYHYSSNNPINYLDPDGNNEYHFTRIYYTYENSKGKLVKESCLSLQVIQSPEPDVFFYQEIETFDDPSNNINGVVVQWFPLDGQGTTSIHLSQTRRRVLFFSYNEWDDDQRTMAKILKSNPHFREMLVGGIGQDLQRWQNVFADLKNRKREKYHEDAGHYLMMFIPIAVEAAELVGARALTTDACAEIISENGGDLFFRGGSSFEMSAADIRMSVDKATQLMKPNKGMSINTNPLDPNVASRGTQLIGIRSVPSELNFNWTKGTHYEIGTASSEMPVSTYQNLVNQIQTAPY